MPRARPAITQRQFEALAQFRYQLRKFLRYSERVTRRHGLTPLQYQLLLQIKGFPGPLTPSVGQLAERLQAQHHGVVALITRCVKRGLLRRSVDPGDRRAVRPQLTLKGEQALGRLAQLHRDELLALNSELDKVRQPARRTTTPERNSKH